MFKRYWLNGFALGIVAGFLFTPALIFAAILLGVSPNDFSQSDSQPYSGEQEGPKNDRWWLIRSVVYMDDTAAQWIMMFATIFAAYLLLRTLWATQEMARETTRIGEAQTRAYLSVTAEPLHMHPTTEPKWRCGMLLRLSNSGLSPARNIEITCDWHLVCDGESIFEGKSTHPTYEGIIDVGGNGGSAGVDTWLDDPVIPESAIPKIRDCSAHWEVFITVASSNIYETDVRNLKYVTELAPQINGDGFKLRMKRVKVN